MRHPTSASQPTDQSVTAVESTVNPKLANPAGFARHRKRGPLGERVLELVDALAHSFGRSWATERSMRAKIGETSDLPGERSVSRVLRKKAREGIIIRKRILPGGRLPNGHYSKRGTTTNVRLSRHERRAERKRRERARRAAERGQKRPKHVPIRRIVDENEEQQLTLAQWRERSAPFRDLMASTARPPKPEGEPPDT